MYFSYFAFPFIYSQHANRSAIFNIQLYLSWIMVLLCSAPIKTRVITVAQEAWTPHFLASSPFTGSLSSVATTLASLLPHTC